MKATRTVKSPILHIVSHRIMPVRFRLHLPSLNRQHQPAGPKSEPGTAFETGLERFCGEGYYKVAEHEQELEQLLNIKTVVLMITPNR